MYFDVNSTTPVRHEVRDAMTRCLRDLGANPSTSYRDGRKTREAVERARQQVAAAVGADPDEIFFTSGASEANNTVLHSVAQMRPERRALITPIEHASVAQGARAHLGDRVDELRVDGTGRVPREELLGRVSRDHGCVAMILGNNEIGTIQPPETVRAAAEWCERNRAIFHLDVTQCVGKVPVNLHALGCHTASMSAHKVYGPKGVGALYIRRDAQGRVEPLISGGSQEASAGRFVRAGTENVPGILGMGMAFELSAAEVAREGPRLRGLRDLLQRELLRAVPGSVVHALGADRLPNTLSISFPRVNSRAFCAALDEAGVAVNVGSACSKQGRSKVLASIGVSEELERGVVRISLGKSTGARECQRLVGLMRDLHGRCGTSACPRQDP